MSRFASPSRAAGLLLVVLLAAGVSVPTRGVHPPAVLAGSSYLFLSPNTDDHLTPAEASARLASPAQQRYHRLAGDILQQLGVRGAEVHDVVGDWCGGVENSLLVVLPGAASPDALRCAAAWFGLLAEQQAVLAFHADPEGPDVLTVLDLPGRDLAAVRRLLDQHGVHDRTILACPHGSRVVVVDAEGRQAEALQRVARYSGGRLRGHAGRSESLAGPTRPLARLRYHEVIRAYQVSQPPPRLTASGR